MPPGKSVFQKSWLEKEDYQGWLAEDVTKYNARCTICLKSFDISNMGEAALRSHQKGTKHQKLVKAKGTVSVSMDDFVVKEKEAGETTVTTSKEKQGSSTTSIGSFLIRNDCLRAEILWALKVVTCHYSFRSCTDLQQVFAQMFPDSEIAQKFTCGEKKCAYICYFGIAPYIRQLLKDAIADQDGFVLLFDESLNKVTRNKQMDVHCRIWGKDAKVVTRYYGSAFMGHATADDMVKHFDSCTEGLNMSNLLQISMDGPNVNWKFHSEMQTNSMNETGKSLIMVGSCGLHIVHGSLRHGCAASDWPIQSLLQSLHRLFKDTPARREDYMSATGSNNFPLKFCAHRWVENVQVAERAVEIWPHIEEYVKKVTEKAVSNPSTISYDTVVACTKDPLILVKLLCFISIAKQVNPFLVIYQTDKPMLPFIAEDLFRMLSAIMKRFLKKDLMDSADSAIKLMKVDPLDKSFHCSHSKVDLGFAAEQELRKCRQSHPNTISDRQVLQVRMECRDFLAKLSSHLMNKCPLKYPLARSMSCLDPRKLATSKDICLKKMKRVLTTLVNANRVQGGATACDDILRQFEEFIDTSVAENHSTFASFDPHKGESRVDVLLREFMGNNQQYKLVWRVVRHLLLLSHGQATVERGFSINRQVEVENLKEESVVAQRLICDHVESVGGLHKVDLSKKLLLAAASARQKYMSYLEEQRKAKEMEEVGRKRKDVLDEIDELKRKKKRLESDIAELTKSADEYAEKSEDTGKLTLLAKSNSLRRTAKEKIQLHDEVSKQLDVTVKNLKQ